MTGLWIMIVVLAVLTVVATWLAQWYMDSTRFTVGALIVCIVASTLLVWGNWMTTYRNDHWATCHVTGKDRGGDNGSYRIYTSDCGQLANEDSVLRGKFDSADVWQRVPDKGTVKLRIAGVRFGPFSQVPNVFDAEPVQE